MKNIAQSLKLLRRQIVMLAERHGRNPDAITLLAVSKHQPADRIRAAAAAGQADFGENYLQEALDKIQALAGHDLNWHFIGKVQSNKTGPVAESFAWLHSLDREKIARRLHEQRAPGLPPLNVCIQVNISAEASKSGVPLAQVPDLASAVMALPRLKLRGLMALPAPAAELQAQREPFRKLRQALESLNAQGLALDTLSMGTSTDLEAAIAEGATLVRVGTGLFGPRPQAGSTGHRE